MPYALETRQFMTPRGQPVQMTYRQDTNDYNTLFASLDSDEYGLVSTNISGRAFDVGGYLGSVGIAIAIDYPGAQVTIIEPVPSNIELIRTNIAQNGVGDRVYLMEGAVGSPKRRKVTINWGYRGTESLEHHAFVGNSTLAGETPTPIEHSETVYAPITLASLVKDEDIAFLKIDCEGGEWEFLTGPLDRIGTIAGEWHPVRGHTQAEMAERLAPTHEVTFSGPLAGPGGFRAVRR